MVELWNLPTKKQLETRNYENFKKAKGREQDEYRLLERESKHISESWEVFSQKTQPKPKTPNKQPNERTNQPKNRAV